jgi:hypothetical protein
VSLSAAFSLVVLTLNAGGPNRFPRAWPQRRDAIAADLKTEGPALAAFQEIRRAEDLTALKAAAGHGFDAFDPDLGLAVTSRFPILSRESRDLGGGWGVLSARVADGKLEFDAYSVRLKPEDGPADADKLGRMFRLAEFVRTRSAGRPFVLLGDLGLSADEPTAGILLDLLEARDLCVSHGDEVCGATSGPRRTDYALIPYSSRTPREYARAAFAGLEVEGDSAARSGLRVRLDELFPSLKPALSPSGRDEALDSVGEALRTARLAAADRASRVGWIPFLGTARELSARAEAARLAALEEEVHSARLLSSHRPD